MRVLLLDCGGVMVYPTTGDWMVPPGALPDDFLKSRGEAFHAAKRAAAELLPDGMRLDDDRQEYEQLLLYYERVLNGEMRLRLGAEAIGRVARAQAFGDERYGYFPDVAPQMRAWRGSRRVALVSDAPPSLARILRVKGYWELLDAASLSCWVGVLKPDARMYESALSALGAEPEDAVFVDDLPKNLEGARRLGITAVQMRRPMPEGYPPAPAWDGPVVRDFCELDALLRAMEET